VIHSLISSKVYCWSLSNWSPEQLCRHTRRQERMLPRRPGNCRCPRSRCTWDCCDFPRHQRSDPLFCGHGGDRRCLRGCCDSRPRGEDSSCVGAGLLGENGDPSPRHCPDGVVLLFDDWTGFYFCCCSYDSALSSVCFSHNDDDSFVACDSDYGLNCSGFLGCWNDCDDDGHGHGQGSNCSFVCGCPNGCR